MSRPSTCSGAASDRPHRMITKDNSVTIELEQADTQQQRLLNQIEHFSPESD